MTRNLVRWFTLALLAVVFTFSLAPHAAAQTDSLAPTRERLSSIFKEMPRAHYIGQVSVSPDGAHFAWIDETGNLIVAVRNADGKKDKERKVDMGDACQAASFTWSPKSNVIALFASCGDSLQQNLYIADAQHSDDKARRVTELKGYVEAPAFSPDGGNVAFLYVEGATRPAGALAAMKPWSGVIGEDGLEIQRVAIAHTDVEKPAPVEFATPANLHVYEYDWRPDGKGIAFIAAEPPGENNWWVADLYSVEFSNSADNSLTPSAPKVLLAPPQVAGPLHGLQIAVPRWSPDGSSIAFIGGLMSDQGETGGDLWLVSAKGGVPRNLTPGRPASPAWLDWADNDHIFITEVAEGEAELVKLHLSGPLGVDGTNFGSPVFRIPASISDGRIKMSLSSTSDHSLFVFTASGFDNPPEMVGVRPGNVMDNGGSGFTGLMQLSSFNTGLKSTSGKVHSLHWKNEGFNVQGWLREPDGFDPAKDAGKKYPLIVIVHGGPSSSVLPSWGPGSLGAAIFTKLGYFVLEPNPRGSYGEGETFTQANRKDFGYGDLRDIIAGVDAVEAKFPVDDKRVGLTGWSYGGFMTMFGVTQTHRFRAAVAGAGLSNWQSYYGQNSIDQWMIPFFGASVYDDPAVYAKSSAINFIKNVTTPTLVVVGDRDGECPAPQSFEFWHALRDQHVKTQLVVYPNEGHAFSQPAHWVDVLTRAVDWFDREMAP
jgi:dipeptidyl aminopeptidase/acylaminoacyl peptidase